MNQFKVQFDSSKIQFNIVNHSMNRVEVVVQFNKLIRNELINESMNESINSLQSIIHLSTKVNHKSFQLESNVNSIDQHQHRIDSPIVPHPNAIFSVLLMGGNTLCAQRYTRLSMACTRPTRLRDWPATTVRGRGDWRRRRWREAVLRSILSFCVLIELLLLLLLLLILGRREDGDSICN